jgi:hypothetical protein
MQLNALAMRVQESRLLTEAEKMYWMQHLPRMNTEQISKLEGILDEAEKLPWTEQMKNYLQIATKGSAPLTA